MNQTNTYQSTQSKYVSGCLRVTCIVFSASAQMEFFTSLLTNLVLPVIIISASFGLVFVYGFKSQPSQPDFKGFSFNEEEEKPKSKKLKPKKTVRKLLIVTFLIFIHQFKLQPKKPVQNVVQKAPKKTDKVATEIKVAEVPQVYN